MIEKAEKVHISLFFTDFFLSQRAYFFPVSLFFSKSLIIPPPRGVRKRPEYPPLGERRLTEIHDENAFLTDFAIWVANRQKLKSS